MNDQTQNERPRRRVLPAIVISALAAALALPAGAALAGGGNGDSGGTGGATLQQVQQETPDGEQPRPEGEQQRPDGHPCPEDERGGSDQGGSGESSSTAWPEV
jgi:hypothetical protein